MIKDITKVKTVLLFFEFILFCFILFYGSGDQTHELSLTRKLITPLS